MTKGATVKPFTAGPYLVRLAQGEADLRAAQRLRYDVFVQELGADGPLIDHENRLERDAFDAAFDHLILIDTAKEGALEGQVVGAYRLLPGDRLIGGARFYCEGEFDLGVLRSSGRRLLEMGRLCIHPGHRNAAGLACLWSALKAYVRAHEVEVLFGAASLHGTDPQALAQPLSYLYHRHLAPPPLRVRARGEGAVSMDLLTPEQLDARAGALALPALLQSYLRFGGVVGAGAFVDRPFNTVDVCMILEAARVFGGPAR